MSAESLRRWLGRPGAKARYVTPGSPRESGYCEPFNGWLREAQVSIEASRVHFNTIVLTGRSAIGLLHPKPLPASL